GAPDRKQRLPRGRRGAGARQHRRRTRGGGLNQQSSYRDFLEAKVRLAPSMGFDVSEGEISPILKPHQRAIVRWMVAGGRRACFASFGLGKTLIQLETVRLTRERVGGKALIVAPLGVRQEFMHDARMVGVPLRFIRSIEEAEQVPIDGSDP